MKKKWKALLAGSLVMALSLVAFGCGGNKDQEQPPQQAGDDSKQQVTVEEGKLRVAMECGYAPFNWTQTDDANGAVPIDGDNSYANGYDVQIAKKIAESMGLELVVVKTGWDALPPAVQSGTVDLIVAGMSPTTERAEVFVFSHNYFASDLVMVVRSDSEYANATSIADFAGAEITAQLNTFHYTVIDQIEGVNKLTAMDDFPAMRVALQSGIIDGYVSERPEGLSAQAADSDFTFVSFDEGNGFDYRPDDAALAAGMKKGNTALAEAVNKAIDNISEDDRKTLMNEAIANQPAAQ